MKKTCVYCGRIHKKGYICPDKPKKFKNRTTKDKFRSTIAWQKKRNAVAERDLWLCRVCLEQGRLNGDSLQVHHITPLSEDYSLRLEDDNLITLCPVHHEQAECGQIPAGHLRELAVSPPVPELPMNADLILITMIKAGLHQALTQAQKRA